MLIEAIKSENFAHFPELIRRHFYTHLCESSTHDFCVLPLQICKAKCDWFIRADVTEIVFGGNKRQPELRLRSQATEREAVFRIFRDARL